MRKRTSLFNLSFDVCLFKIYKFYLKILYTTFNIFYDFCMLSINYKILKLQRSLQRGNLYVMGGAIYHVLLGTQNSNY